VLHRARLQRGTGIGRRMLRVQSSEVFDSPGGNTELGAESALSCIVVCRLADEWDEHSRLALDDVERHVFNPVNYLTHQGAAPSRGRSLLSTIAVYCRV